MADTIIRRPSTGKGSRASRPDWVAAVLWRNPRLLARVLWLRANIRLATRRATLSLCGAALLLALGGAPALGGATAFGGAPAHADAITVVNGEVAVVQNDLCSLIEAIHNANDTIDGLAHADCAPGDPAGADEIVLPRGGLFSLTAPDNTTYGPTGLPVITGEVVISGAGGTTIRRAATAAPFRVLAVGPDGGLSLERVMISGGRAAEAPVPPITYAEAGGGVLNLGQLSVIDAVISDNDNGIVNTGTARIDRTAIIDNGRGIFNLDGELAFINSTISGNHNDGEGGGIAALEGEVYGLFSTVTDNEAQWGGGLFAAGRVYDNYCRIGAIRLNNSILSGNRAGAGPEGLAYVYSVHCPTSFSLNSGLVGHDGEAGLVNSSVDPLAVPDEPLAAILDPELTAGATWTPHHALPSGSPAIDALPDVACRHPALDGVDQLGQSRNVDGDKQPSDGECDIGAIERQQSPYRQLTPFIVGAMGNP